MNGEFTNDQFKYHRVINAPTMNRIIELLKEHIVLSTSQIARKLRRYKGQVYLTLNRLEVKGIVEHIDMYQPLVPDGKPIKVTYWYLKENRDKALKILKILK